MNIRIVLVAICSLLFLMLGADKFLNFLEPSCSLMDKINPTVWKILGASQIVTAGLIWLPQFSKFIASFFFGLMVAFTFLHLYNGTYDIGGSVFFGVLLLLVAWNPSFLKGKG